MTDSPTPQAPKDFFPKPRERSWERAFAEAIGGGAEPSEAAFDAWNKGHNVAGAGLETPKLDSVPLTRPPKARSTSTLNGVRSITECDNIRALGPRREPIVFSPWLTVFYGRNGSGKSSMSQLLDAFTEGGNRGLVVGRADSNAAHDKYDSPRSGRIEAHSLATWRAAPVSPEGGTTLSWTSGADPSGTLDLELLDKEHLARFDRQLRMDLEPQLGLEVFDLAIAGLKAFASGVAKVGSLATTQADALFPKSEEDDAQAALELLQAVEADTLEELIDERKSATQISAALGEVEKTSESLAKRFQQATSELGAMSVLELPTSAQAQVQATEARLVELERVRHEGLTALLAQRPALPVGNTDAWNRFIQAGESALKEARRGDYPAASDSCIYCGQELGEAALGFLTSVRSQVFGELHSERERLTGQRRGVLEAMQTLRSHLGLPEDFLESENWIDLVPTAEKLLELRRILEGERDKLAAEQSRLTDPEKLEADRVEANNNLRKASLRCFAKENATKLKRLGLLREIERSAQGVPAEVASWQQQWSTQKTRASEALGLEAFQKLFDAEYERMRMRVPLSLGVTSPAGLTERKYVSRGREPRKTLSESEVVTWAVADLLAELSHGRTGSALLIDDPIGSMDTERMALLVYRILNETDHRQVIVFTHNRHLFLSIVEAIGKKPFKGRAEFARLYHIEAFKGTTGYVSPYDRAENPRAILERVRTLAAGGPMDPHTVDLCFLLIRRAIEATIDKVILRGVRSLYDPEAHHVDWESLRSLKAPTGDAVVRLEDLFRGISRLGGLHITGEFHLSCPIADDVTYYATAFDSILAELEAHHGPA